LYEFITRPPPTTILFPYTTLFRSRTDTAQDNGIQFFKWLQKYTNINAYYVIDEDSNDYDNVSNLNNIITFGSKKHFEVSSKCFRSEEHTSELQSRFDLVCRLLLEK